MKITRIRATAAYAIAALTLLTGNASLYAVDIFDNPITDASPSSVNPFTAGQTCDPNISVSGIGFGSGVSSNAGSNRFNAKGWSFPSMDTSDYFTWTLTPNSGNEIDFNSLAGNWQRSGTGPNTYSLRSSLDNFASEIAGGAITGSGSAAAYSLSLSSLQHVTTPIEFRLFAFAGTAAAGTFSINDFTFDGSVNQVSTPVGLAGDYNNDGSVDAADYVIYRSSLVSSTPLLNETASIGVVDPADYDAWKANFGAKAAGGGSLSSVSVPEPASALLMFAAFCGICGKRAWQSALSASFVH